MLSDVEPDLRQIIKTLRDGNNLQNAMDRTVGLIESTFRMSGPMYREENKLSGGGPERPTYNYAAGKLRTLTKDLRDVSFTMRRGAQTGSVANGASVSEKWGGFGQGYAATPKMV
jgi:hypothetical protein